MNIAQSPANNSLALLSLFLKISHIIQGMIVINNEVHHPKENKILSAQMSCKCE
ncbi:hypothetical protein [Niallia taxi]|uniref:hypothetical protein n=1 Tax=Niallia taxi TaxID=2499688 RepID=UPI00254EF27B|nr:hypothetical protein [Niallia taxi]MDK8641963.1 hypothetical protein [Niallia taxi]